MSSTSRLLVLNAVNVSRINKRFAGHSKWANIKHIKAAKDAERSAIFTKIARDIKVAIQEHGSTNPSVNSKLAQIIERAKKQSMPMATIENVIRTSQINKNNCKSYTLEIKAQNGVIVLCDVLTENFQGLKMKLNTILKKFNAAFSDGGGKYLFNKKGLVEVKIPETYKNNPNFDEISVEHAIEVGAEDVNKLNDDRYIFLCEDTQLKQVETGLENLKYEILSAEVEYLPNMYVNISENEVQKMLTMLEKLETTDEVVKLYHNIEL